MADIADVRLAIASLIAAAAYPNGTSSASAITGLTDKCAVYQNDPKPEDIDQRIPAGDILVSVADLPQTTSTTRFPPVVTPLPAPAPTLTWTVSGTSATLGGTVTVPQNLALIVDRTPFVYGVQTGDTLATASAAIGALVAAKRSVSVSGSTITVPGSHAIIARVGVVCSTITEVGRQLSRLEITIRAKSDALRSAAVAVVKPALDGVTRIALPDSTTAWVKTGTEVSDWRPLKLGIATSCLVYPVEWATVQQGTAAELIAWTTTVQGGSTDIASFTPTSPPTNTVSG